MSWGRTIWGRREEGRSVQGRGPPYQATPLEEPSVTTVSPETGELGRRGE